MRVHNHKEYAWPGSYETHSTGAKEAFTHLQQSRSNSRWLLTNGLHADLDHKEMAQLVEELRQQKRDKSDDTLQVIPDYKKGCSIS